MGAKLHHHHHHQMGYSSSSTNYYYYDKNTNNGNYNWGAEKEAGVNWCVSWWVEKYFKDCLCSLRDEVSFALGIISLICWGLAEIPQIITNFHNKSAAGISLSFLLTWILGDVFNLVGCILDPATLPTQFFTALLYTATTVVLLLQCIYYEYFLRWWHNGGGGLDKKNLPNVKIIEEEEEEKEWLLQASKAERHHHFIPASGGVVRVPTTTHSQSHFYFMSARTLASSDTPPRCSYIKPRSGPPALHNPYSSDSDDDGEQQPAAAASITQPRSIPHRAYGAFLAAAAYCPVGGKAAAVLDHVTAAGRTQDRTIGANNNVGQWLGWMMAAIYMGGRIPQIWLNMKRGSFEGLNPLMFIFVLVANATYFASILVRSMEWEKIMANMAWLVDAVACVLLDLFIILQYLYYTRGSKTKRKKKTMETPKV